MLSKEKLNEIGRWILENGRPLEAARFAYHFENASNEAVLSCLKTYQNQDGGFGRGIESDCQNPSSSPVASATALLILFETGFDKSNDMIANCLRYVAHNHYDEETGMWATMLSSNNDHPHAPWWTWVENGRNTWDFNPAMELAGSLLYYSEPGSFEYELGSRSFAKAESYLYSPNDMAEHFHEVFCFINGLALAKLKKEGIQADLISMENKIKEYIERAMCRDESKWLTEYVAQPIDFMNKLNIEDSCAVTAYKKELIANANSLINSLPEKGVWDITWTWGVQGQYNEVFEQIRPYWQGVLAVDRLVKFKRLGFIESE